MPAPAVEHRAAAPADEDHVDVLLEERAGVRGVEPRRQVEPGVQRQLRRLLSRPGALLQ